MIDSGKAKEGMMLTSLLMKLDPATRVHIACEELDGSTFRLCDMDWGWTAKDCMENLSHSAYEVLSLSVSGGVLFVSCSKLPWDCGRYWDEDGRYEYKAVFTCEALVREPDELSAMSAAGRRFGLGDFDRAAMSLFMH